MQPPRRLRPKGVIVAEAEHKLIRCTHEREGPRVGYRVIAWRQQCKRKVAVTEGQLARCWQHGGATKKS